MARKKTSNTTQDKCDLTIGEVAIERLLYHLRCGDMEAIRIVLSNPEVMTWNVLEFQRHAIKHMREFDAIISKEKQTHISKKKGKIKNL